jgi:hypothetical protein
MKNLLLIGLNTVLLLFCGIIALSSEEKKNYTSTKDYEEYDKVVKSTAAMVSDRDACNLAAKYKLQVLNVTWEDTGRYKNSSVGPNISDMTIQVQQMHPVAEKFTLTCMPVIRFPNFSDKTGDLKMKDFYLMVGNEKGRGLKKVSLDEFLGNIRQYMNKPDSWKGKSKSLLAERDTHVLVSAQACFLPIPKKGIASFNPVIFNYPSYQGDPAVLTILATREGTSVTIIDNKRDAFQAGWSWGQRLFFNQNGQRASLTGKRLSDYNSEIKLPPDSTQTPSAAKQEGLNMVLLIQVPLKQKKPMEFSSENILCAPGNVMKGNEKSRDSNVEAAVIGHGDIEGPFTEIDNLEIERDTKFPVRVTVQFYKATGNGVVSGDDMAEIANQINKVYEKADYVGSLVIDGPTNRPTEYEGTKFEPPDWWASFWERHEKNIGLTPEETIARLRKLYGPNYTPKNEEELLREATNLKYQK